MIIQRTLFDGIVNKIAKDVSVPCRVTKDGVELFVSASSKASSSRIQGIVYDADGRAYLKVFITEAPENNKANKAIIELLAVTFNIPKSCITLKTGASYRLKCFSLDGISHEEVMAHIS